MSAETKSLRERKKERTRRIIRTEAFRLFRDQGYAETTVEQIAAAADISPSTFFRYFPSKEQLVLADDLDPAMIEIVEGKPAAMPVLQALREATVEVFTSLSPEDYEFELQRQELIAAVPELRGALAREYERNIDLLAMITARRTGRSADDFEVRAFAGALVGALLANLKLGQSLREDLLRTFDFLEAGMPL
jgi:AcrR family transcriptional regulator